MVFVHDLVSSVDFYGELLGMHVTLRTNAAALLVNAHGSQLYLRMMGPDAAHALGSVGVQFVIWTADGPEDLRRCERLLKSRSAHVNTQTGDGFTLVEGRDPNQLPVVVTYPGPDQAPRHEILPRIYTW